MNSPREVRILAYSMSVNRIHAIEFGADFVREHDFGPVAGVLDCYDGLAYALRSAGALSVPRVAELEEFAADWGQKLLPSDWLESPPSVGVIIPHGLLHGLPFHVVRTSSGEPLCTASGLTRCSSLTRLLRCLERAPSWRRKSVADPFLGPKGSSKRYFAAAVDALGHSDDEWIRMILRLIPEAGMQLEDDENTVRIQGLREALVLGLMYQEYDFAIIAAHGYHDPLDALGSGLFARGKSSPWFWVRKVSVLGRTEDEEGVPYDLQDMPTRELPPGHQASIDSEMLTLSDLEGFGHILCPLVAVLGCQSGVPTLHAGDQPLSMAEMMLRIGAAATVAPMWDVRLSVVEAWMRSFLREWKLNSMSRAEAARNASLSLYREGMALHDVGCLVLSGNWR